VREHNNTHDPLGRTQHEIIPMINTRKTTTKRKIMRRNTNRNDSNPNPQDMSIVIFRNLTPSKLVVPIRYRWAQTQLANNGFSNASKTLRVNAPYDVDASLGSTSSVGFTEYAALFANYRVRKVQMNVNIVNTENISLEVCIALSTDFFGSNAYDKTFFFNRNNVVKRMSKAGGQDQCSLSITRTTEQIVGDTAVRADRDYASATTTVPQALIYGIVATDSGNASFTQTANGCQVTWEVTMWIEFYNPKMLLS
jgi:hypothetical protein